MYVWIFILVVVVSLGVKSSKYEPSLILLCLLDLLQSSNLLYSYLATHELVVTLKFMMKCIITFSNHVKCTCLSSCKTTCLIILVKHAESKISLFTLCNTLICNSLPSLSAFRCLKLTRLINSKPLMLYDDYVL